MLKGKIIVIDPGHGGTDPGAVDGIDLKEGDKLNTKEAFLNLLYSYDLKKELELKGAIVYLTRTKDVFVPLVGRANFANAVRANLFVSIHMNSAVNKSASGHEVLYIGYSKSFEVAKKIDAEFDKNLGTKDRNVVARPELAVLRLTKCPAVLVEVGFISNPIEEAKLANPAFRIQTTKDIVAAIEKSL